jgi:hypothetical protein
VKWKELLDQHFLGNAATTTVNSQDKDRFYLEIYSSFCAIKDLNTLANHINPRIFRLDQTIASLETHLLQELQLFEVEMNQLFPEFPTTRVELYGQYNLCLENLRSFSTHFEDGKLSAQATNIFGNSERILYSRCLEKIGEEAQSVSASGDHDELIHKLIQIKLVGIHIFSMSVATQTLLDR